MDKGPSIDQIDRKHLIKNLKDQMIPKRNSVEVS